LVLNYILYDIIIAKVTKLYCIREKPPNVKLRQPQ
jgi:hypothetical protein